MASIADIREALAANLSTVLDFQASPYMLSNPTPPTAHVVPGEIEFDLANSRGLDMIVMNVQVFVALTSDIGSQKQLDKYFDGSGTRSIKQAIEADSSLGGACDDLIVKRISGYRMFRFAGGAEMVGAEWRVEIYAHGD